MAKESAAAAAGGHRPSCAAGASSSQGSWAEEGRRERLEGLGSAPRKTHHCQTEWDRPDNLPGVAAAAGGIGARRHLVAAAAAGAAADDDEKRALPLAC